MTVYPRVSIIMPVRNEAEFIARGISAIQAQDYPRARMEVLVVDGNSTDGTKKEVQRAALAENKLQIKTMDNPSLFMPAGFNLGLRHAQGDIIVMLGGHAEIAPDYVRRGVQFLLENPEASCVGGAMNTKSNDAKGNAIALAMRSKFGVGNVSFRTSVSRQIRTDTAVYGLYRRSVFEKIGGLDEDMLRNQDDEFNHRLREHGGIIFYAPEIRSTYYSRASLPSLWRQYYQYGLYKVRVLQKHPRQMSLRQFVPPAFALSLLASMFLAFFPAAFSRLPIHPSFLIPAFYILANLTASARIASIHGWKRLPLLPLIFTILHLSYGLGFLNGLLKFWNRWSDKGGKIPIIEPLP